MSKYTTETRYICQTYAQTYLSENEYLSIDETIEKSIPFIFNHSWSTYDPDHKQELCKKILRHYYLREIGFETVGLWKLEMNEYLAEIMPKYNVLYANLEDVKNKLLANVDTTETRDLTSNQKTTAESSNTSTDHTKADASSNADSSANASSEGNSDSWQESNDTPQGGLDGIESRRYLSSAVHNRGNQSSSQNNAGTSSSTSTNTSDSTNNSTGSSTGNSNTSESYTLKVLGKNSGSSYIDEYLKIQSQYNDIDAAIINDLNICFMGLWE